MNARVTRKENMNATDFHGRDHLLPGFYVVGIALENFIAQRHAALGDDQANTDLFAFRTLVA